MTPTNRQTLVAACMLAALIVAVVAGAAQGAFSVLASVMLARVYAELAGGGAEATVPSSGT